MLLQVCVICSSVLAPAVAAAETLDLPACLRLALRHRPELGGARAEVSRAEAERLGSHAGYLPQLAMQASSSYSHVGRQDSVYIEGQQLDIPQDPYDANLHSLGLTWRQTLFDGGRWWHQRAQAGYALASARQQEQAVREQVALEVAEAFFELLKARRHLEVRQQSLAMSQEQLRVAEERHRIGTVSRGDLSRSRVGEGEDRMDIRRQIARVRAAEVRLNLSMGRPPRAPLVLQPPEDQAGHSSLLHDEVPAEQAQLAAAIAKRAAAERAVQMAQAGYWPTLSGVLQYERESPEMTSAASRFDEHYVFRATMVLSIPIFDGFLTTAEVQAAEATARQLADRVALTRQRLKARLVEARHNLVTLQEAASIGLANIEAAQDSLTVARERYGLGQGTVLEVRDAQLSLNRARLRQAEARFDAQIALANYHFAAGDLLATYLPAQYR